jgi:preprotein translocase subunit SecE
MADNITFAEKVGRWPVAVKDYLQELQMEMRRVTWPSRKQVQSTTVVVIVTVFMFAAYFAVIDTVFTRLIGKLFKVFTNNPM